MNQYSAPQQLPPMGWYPDPGGSGAERYWDGASWTNNLRPAQTPPPSAAYLTSSPASTPFAYVAPHQTGGQGFAPVVEAATWLRRAGAVIIDWLVLYIVTTVLVSPFASEVNDASASVLARLESGQMQTPDDLWALMVSSGYMRWAIIVSSMFFVVQLLYFAVQWALWGCTLGQRATGVGVVRAADPTRRIGWGAAIGRAILVALCMVIPLWIVLLALWAAGGRDGRGLHDLLCGSRVVMTRR